MLNLKGKHDKWITKITKGDDDYMAIAKVEGDWCLLWGHDPRRILSLVMIIDEGEGLHLQYTYSADKPEQNPINTTIVIKEDRKMIFDINGEYYSYGMGIPSPAKTMFLYFRTEASQFMVFGSNESKMINVTYDLHNESDAAAIFMNSLVEFMNPPITEVHYAE